MLHNSGMLGGKFGTARKFAVIMIRSYENNSRAYARLFRCSASGDNVRVNLKLSLLQLPVSPSRLLSFVKAPFGSNSFSSFSSSAVWHVHPA